METKIIYYGSELYHHGILGQKWGERRYQNPDGTLTPEGKERYGVKGKGLTATNREVKKFKSKYRHDKREELTKELKTSNKRYKQITDRIEYLKDNYDFDQDDGGGGSTKADRKAGAEYMKLWDELYKYEDDIDYRAQKATADKVLEIYGTKKSRRSRP